MASEKQIQACRRNALKSTGPRTAEGKRASARNSTKHGLTGSGQCLPDELREELQAEIGLFYAELRPQTHVEQRLAEQAALASVRHHRASAAAQALTGTARRAAVRAWDEARAAEVAALASRLTHDPANAVVGLGRTAEGCDELADRWDALRAALESVGHWDHFQVDEAVHLLGVIGSPPPRAGTPAHRLRACALACHPRPDPRHAALLFPGTPAEAMAQLPPAAEARAELIAFMEGEIARLEAQGAALWERFDGPDRADAGQAALTSTDAEVGRLYRYQTSAASTMRASLAALERYRREAKRLRSDPDAPGPVAAPSSPATIAAVPPAAPRNEPNSTPAEAAVGIPASPPRNEPNFPPAVLASTPADDLARGPKSPPPG